MVASGSDSTYIASVRASTKAAMIVSHWTAARWPAALERWSAHGAPRELDSMERCAYLTSGGIGAAAQEIVLRRIDTVVSGPQYDVLRDFLRPGPDEQPPGRDATAYALRRAQQVFELPQADIVTIGSLERLSGQFAARRPLLNSEEVRKLKLADRADFFSGMAPARGGAAPALA
eukprot:6964016-Prymnesium_polylepis.1